MTPNAIRLTHKSGKELSQTKTKAHMRSELKGRRIAPLNKHQHKNKRMSKQNCIAIKSFKTATSDRLKLYRGVHGDFCSSSIGPGSESRMKQTISACTCLKVQHHFTQSVCAVKV